MKHDSTKSILKSASHFFSGTILSRITGLLRDIVMAFAFGTQETVAAFFVAYRLAHLLRRVLGEGALQMIFAPKFEEMRKENPAKAFAFFGSLSASLTLLLLAVIGLSMMGLAGTLSYLPLSEGNREIVLLTLIMMPSLLFICLYGLNSSLLQCEKKYFITGAAPVFFNLVWIAGALLVRDFSQDNAMISLAVIIILACFVQWAATLPETLRILNREAKILPWRTPLFSKELFTLGKPLALGLIGITATQINNAFDAVFARYADSSGPALLWYAIRIQQVPLALFGIALSYALLPPLSRAFKAGDFTKYRLFLNDALKKCVLIMIPMTLVLILAGNFGIRLVYGRGFFSEESISGTTHCLWAYSLGLVPMSLVLLLAPAFYSRGNYATPTKASLLSVATNLALNAFLVMVLDLGAVSVAIATSISAWVNYLILQRALYRTEEYRTSVA